MRSRTAAVLAGLIAAGLTYVMLRPGPSEPTPSPSPPGAVPAPRLPPRAPPPEQVPDAPDVTIEVRPAGFPPGSRVVIDGTSPRRFEVDGGSFDLSLAGVRQVRGEADGYVPWELELAMVRPVLSQPAPRRLSWFATPRKGRAIQGRVVFQNVAVPGATVRCVQPGMYGIAQGSPRTWTDADGRFSVACGEGRSKLVATHPDFRRAVTDWLELDALAREPTVIELTTGFALRGLVRDSSGEPAPDVEVTVRAAPETPIRLHGWDEQRVAFPAGQRTDENGRFAFAEPLTGPVSVTARASSGASVSKEFALTTDLDVELTLEAGNHVSGLVTLDGQPLASAIVQWACGKSRQATQLTDDSGRFQLQQLTPRPEPCFVEVRPTGEETLSVRGAKGGFLGARVPASFGDEHLLLELQSAHAGEVELEFRGAEQGYSGSFTLEPVDPLSNTPQVATVYFPEPGARFVPLRPGRYRLTAALNDGVAPEPQDVQVVGDQTTHVLVRIPDGARRGEATGQFIDARSLKPIPGVRFCYSNSTAPAGICPSADADGRFRFSFSATTISVATGSRDGYRSVSVERKVGSGESPDFGQIALEPE